MVSDREDRMESGKEVPPVCFARPAANAKQGAHGSLLAPSSLASRIPLSRGSHRPASEPKPEAPDPGLHGLLSA
jgi:hypothetical protein